MADPRPARETREILDRLSTQHPGADTELHYHSPFELLIATILSAQSTDARVNIVTPSLFAKYPDARALAAANPADVEPIIVTTGFFRAKTRSIIGAAQALVDRHGGEVPASMDALVELPGVGRKTANVVLGHALGVPGPARRSARAARGQSAGHRDVRRSRGRREAAAEGAAEGALDACRRTR